MGQIGSFLQQINYNERRRRAELTDSRKLKKMCQPSVVRFDPNLSKYIIKKLR